MNNFTRKLLLVSGLFMAFGSAESWGQEKGGFVDPDEFNGEDNQLPDNTQHMKGSVRVIAKKGVVTTITFTEPHVIFTDDCLVKEGEDKKSVTATLVNNLEGANVTMKSEHNGMKAARGEGAIGYSVTFMATKISASASDEMAKFKKPIQLGVNQSEKLVFTIDKDDFGKANPGVYFDILTLTLSGK